MVVKDLLLIGFILTAPLSSTSGAEQDAYIYASKAFYVQSGLEQAVNIQVQKQLKDVPEEIKYLASNSFLIAKTIKERQLTLSWTF